MADTLPTKEQFLAYRRVQKEGRFNMVDPRARQATGLSLGTYWACMDYYDVLLKKYGKEEEDA